jgi:hypothetical protein
MTARAGHLPLPLALVMVLAGRAGAQAPPGSDPLTEANAALEGGAYQRALDLAGPIADAPGPSVAERAEAFRVLGLARYFLGQHDAAEAAFYAYLRLDPDAQLDPALVPPEVISLFAQVRSKHEAELSAIRKRRARKRSTWINFVPLGGQWQNGDRTKLWILGSAGAVLLSANITSYVLLHRWCGGPADTCDDGEPGTPGYRNRIDQARAAQAINIVSFVGLGALYVYSVYDGIRGQRRLEWEEATPTPTAPPAVGVTVERDSLSLTLGGRF